MVASSTAYLTIDTLKVAREKRFRRRADSRVTPHFEGRRLHFQVNRTMFYHVGGIIILLYASVVVAGINALGARQTSCQFYTFPGIPGGFTDREFVDFSTVKAGDGDVRSFLS